MNKLRLQPRDLRVISAIHELRFLTSELICLIGPFTSRSRANARLLALTRAGLLKRFVAFTSQARVCVYMSQTESQPAERKATLFLEHHLAVNEVLITAQKEPRGPRGVWRKEEKLSSPLGLTPDAVFAGTTADGKEVNLCLEVDLGTESLARWSTKVEKYMAFASSFSLTAPGSRRVLRIAVVCPSLRRLEHLRITTARQTTKGFRFAHFQTIKEGGFWLPNWLSVTEPNKSVF